MDAGVIDRDYRGLVGVLVVNRSDETHHIKTGDRIAQLVLIRIATPEVLEVGSLTETQRGEGGFGSTGESELIDAKELRADQMATLNINPELTTQQRDAGEALLWEYRDLFIENVGEMGVTHLAEHEIKLKPGATPYYCPGMR